MREVDGPIPPTSLPFPVRVSRGPSRRFLAPTPYTIASCHPVRSASSLRAARSHASFWSVILCIPYVSSSSYSLCLLTGYQGGRGEGNTQGPPHSPISQFQFIVSPLLFVPVESYNPAKS